MSHIGHADVSPRAVWPARGVGSDSRAIARQEQRGWEVRSPDAYSTARLAEVLGDIQSLQDLEPDWNLEGARPISRQAMQVASQLVRAVEWASSQQGISWQPPEVGPVPDGSVALTWEGGTRETLMVFRPDQLGVVECISRENRGRSIRQFVSMSDATRLALWTLEGE
jgi:CubicO group peptidase (beta-lactamase class C family)